MEIISKVWKAGTGTLVISIGKNICEYYNIKEGDLLKLEILGKSKEQEKASDIEEVKLIAGKDIEKADDEVDDVSEANDHNRIKKRLQFK